MADFTALKLTIQNYIKQNGNEEITGKILQEVLLAMVQTMGDGAINDLVTALAGEVTARQNADGTLQTNITNEATARGNADTALGTRIDNEITARSGADNVLTTAVNAINTKLAEGYLYAGIATTSTAPSTPTGKVFYIATAAGTYTNFLDSGSSALVVTQGINILKFNGTSWSQEQVYGVDDEPTEDSDKLVKSGGVSSFYGNYFDNQEYVFALIDKDRKLLGYFDRMGVFHVEAGIVTPSIDINEIVSLFGNSLSMDSDIEQRILVMYDRDKRIIKYRDKKGVLHEEAGISTPVVDSELIKPEYIKFKSDKGVLDLKKTLMLYDTNLFTAFDNLVCIGDSLTKSYVPVNMTTNPTQYRVAKVPYPKVVSRLSGNIDFQIIAEGGYTAKGVWDAFGNDIVSKSNAIAVVFLGSNGGLTDTLDTDVVGNDPDNWADNNIGCYCRIVNKLNNFGYKIILLRGWRATVVSVEETAQAVTHVAERFGCACLDAPYTSESAYHKAIVSGYDYLHSNDLGYSWFAIKLIEALSTISTEQLTRLIYND